MKTKNFSLRERAHSIKYAWEGIHAFFDQQHNAIIHLFATVGVIAFAVFLDSSFYEMIALILAIGFVWVSEIFNTAIEAIMDHVSPDQHPKVKLIKDVSAAAVLVSSLTAIVVGLIIFIPKLF
ncbi:MAG TPA: diacylglycerol kinase family protein [Chitinophagaceae bacterium]